MDFNNSLDVSQDQNMTLIDDQVDAKEENQNPKSVLSTQLEIQATVKSS